MILQDFKKKIDTLIADKKYPQALKKINNKLKNERNNEALIHLIGVVYLHQKKISLAEKYFNQSLKINSNYVPSLLNYAFAKQIQNEHSIAISIIMKAINLEPNSVDGNTMAAHSYKALGDLDQAEQYFRLALELNPNAIEALYNLALMLKNKGQIDGSVALLRHALAVYPFQPAIYWTLSNLKSYRFTDEEKQLVTQQLKSVQTPKDLECLLFARAKYLEDDGEYSESFLVLQKANKIKYNNFDREVVNWSNKLHDIKTVYSDENCQSLKGNIAQNNLKGALPVFIVGMPRSGSTLIEQILASHSQVMGASELDFIKNEINQLGELNDKYPQSWTNNGPDSYQRLADNYMQLTQDWQKENVYFTDKYPGNCEYVGPILLAMPEAKIIHTTRHPMDVCLSCFKQNFQGSTEYSFDLKELVDYYTYQDSLMTYWKSLFPGRIHTVAYENVVGQTEQEVNDLLLFMGLPFEENCLSFHETQRNIKTASAGQVTQKIYNSAKYHYKKYGDSLSQLEQLLQQAGFNTSID